MSRYGEQVDLASGNRFLDLPPCRGQLSTCGPISNLSIRLVMRFVPSGSTATRQLPDGRTIREAVDARIAAVLDHGRYILGPEVEELEITLAAYVGVAHCIAVASGTDAAHCLDGARGSGR